MTDWNKCGPQLKYLVEEFIKLEEERPDDLKEIFYRICEHAKNYIARIDSEEPPS